MNELTIQFAPGKAVYAPGETVHGQVRWSFDRAPEAIDVVLFWHTEGHAFSQSGVASRQVWEAPGQRGERSFSFALPDGPHSFRGKLIRLQWAVEAIPRPGGKEHAYVGFVLSTTDAEIQLPELAGEGDARQGPLGFRP